MPLTKQIIKEVVREEVKSEFVPVIEKVDNLAQKVDILSNKVDKLTDVVIDLAGQSRKFDEEQTVLSGQVSNLSDRVEKLELAAS